MRLSDEQYEFIKGEVVALFERYDIRCIPINGFELAYKMGIALIPYFKPKDGYDYYKAQVERARK